MSTERLDWLLSAALSSGVERLKDQRKVELWGESGDGSTRRLIRIITTPSEGGAAPQTARARMQRYSEVARTILQRLFHREPDDCILDGRGRPVRQEGASSEGLLVNQELSAQERAAVGERDVVMLGPELFFVVRSRIAHLLPPDFTADTTVTADQNTCLRDTVLPVMNDVTAVMSRLYGPLAHDGTPVRVSLVPSDERGHSSACACRNMRVVTSLTPSSSSSPFVEIYATPYYEVQFFDSPEMREGKVVELAAHELGHAFIGAGAPQHEAVQEAIARINEFLVSQQYQGALSSAPRAFEGTVLDTEEPEILAGAPGWGLPEHSCLATHGILAHTLYAAYTAGFLRAAGGLQNITSLFHSCISSWNEAKPVGTREPREFAIPFLEQWLIKMNDTIPGFRERFRATGLHQPFGWIPDGERITWRALSQDEWEAVAMRVTRNPRCFTPVAPDSRNLDVVFARVEPLEGTVTVKIPQGHGQCKTHFMGKASIRRSEIEQAAQSSGIELRSGMEVIFTVHAGASIGTKTFVW